MSSKYVLVVEDDVDFAQSLCEFLRDVGYAVTTMDNGSDALEQFNRLEPAITFLDVEMQGLNGIETLKEIRNRNPQANVVLMTGYTNLEVEGEATMHGANGFLHKPLNIDQVLGMTERAMSSAEG